MHSEKLMQMDFDWPKDFAMRLEKLTQMDFDWQKVTYLHLATKNHLEKPMGIHLTTLQQKVRLTRWEREISIEKVKHLEQSL
jgi:hypothetical protein